MERGAVDPGIARAEPVVAVVDARKHRQFVLGDGGVFDAIAAAVIAAARDQMDLRATRKVDAPSQSGVRCSNGTEDSRIAALKSDQD